MQTTPARHDRWRVVEMTEQTEAVLRTIGLDWKAGDVVLIVDDYAKMRRSACLPYGYATGLTVQVGLVQYNILPETLQVIAEKIVGDEE
jgi:hypothetical protein